MGGLDRHGVANSGVYPMDGFPLYLVTFSVPEGVQLLSAIEAAG